MLTIRPGAERGHTALGWLDSYHTFSFGEYRDDRQVAPNEAQLMTAGTGVIHSEFNASAVDPAHFLQIWVDPAVPDLAPGYRQIAFAPSEKQNRLRPIAAPAGATGGDVLAVHQDVRIYAAAVDAAAQLIHPLASGRAAWRHCATGRIVVNDRALAAGDGAAVTGEASLVIRGADTDASELLLFDLP